MGNRPQVQGPWLLYVCELLRKRILVRARRTEDGGLPWLGRLVPENVVNGLIVVVTQLNLELRFQGKKLQGFSCELTRSSHRVFPETSFTIICQIMVPLLLSGLGMTTTGLVMNTIQVCTGPLWGSVGPGIGEPGFPGVGLQP